MASKNTKKVVTAATVRAWGKENGFNTGDRGRLGNPLVTAYNKAHPRAKFTLSYGKAPEDTIKFTVKPEGKKTPVTRSLPVSEVRRLAVAAGFPQKGRLSKDAKVAAFTAAAKG